MPSPAPWLNDPIVAPASETPWARDPIASAPIAASPEATPAPGGWTGQVEDHRTWWYRVVRRPLLTEAQAIAARREQDPGGFAAWEQATPEQRIEATRRLNLSRTMIDETLPENRGRYLPAEGPGQVARAALQGMTFGFADEIAGMLGGNTEFERRRLEQYRAANPRAASLVEMAGALPLAIIPGINAARGATLGARIGYAAATAGIEGALYGAGTAEGGFGNRASRALQVGVPSALAGVAIPIVAPALARAANVANAARHPVAVIRSFFNSFGDSENEAIRPAANTVGAQFAGQIARPVWRAEAAEMATTGIRRVAAQRAEEAARHYSTAELLNPWIAGDTGEFFKTSVLSHIAEQDIILDPVLHPSARAGLGYLDDLAQIASGEAGRIQLTDIETIRRRLVQLGTGANEQDGRALQIVRDAFDDAVGDLVRSELFHGDPAGIAAMIAARVG